MKYENRFKLLIFSFMNVHKVLEDERQFLALTSLYPSEFEELLRPFAARWRQFFKHYTLRRKRRRKPLTARALGQPTKKLASIEDKLFFILYFFKNNHLQQSLAAQFDMNQGQVSRWIKALLPVLEQSITDLHLQPARDMGELVRLFRSRQRDEGRAAQSLHLDVTERSIERNRDASAQKHDYSGKQAGHRLKNSVACDESQYVHFAGFTRRGAVHDKAMADEELPCLGPLEAFSLWFSKDKAYQGYQPPGVHLLEPYKAKPRQPLEPWQKEFNKWVNSIRIACEHAISGIKRCRVVKETLRYFDAGFRDQVFNVACSLHNLRVSRRESYASYALRVRARINLNFYPT